MLFPLRALNSQPSLLNRFHAMFLCSFQFHCKRTDGPNFTPPTACAAASKCKKLTRGIVQLTVVIVTVHITLTSHITVYIMVAGDDIGMVLSPQCFHNLNLHEDIFNHSNIHFWEYMQPGYDALGFISCTGETSQHSCSAQVAYCTSLPCMQWRVK